MRPISDPTIPDNQRTGLDLLTRIEELTDGVSGYCHSWRHLLLACAAEIHRLTRRGDNYCDLHHEANKQLAECENRLRALEATLPKTADGVTIHHGMRVWVHSIYKDLSDWHAVRAMFQPCDSDRAWLLRGGQYDFFSDDCYSSPEAAKAHEARTDVR